MRLIVIEPNRVSKVRGWPSERRLSFWAQTGQSGGSSIGFGLRAAFKGLAQQFLDVLGRLLFEMSKVLIAG